jgi:hypothetical protein
VLRASNRPFDLNDAVLCRSVASFGFFCSNLTLGSEVIVSGAAARPFDLWQSCADADPHQLPHTVENRPQCLTSCTLLQIGDL